MKQFLFLFFTLTQINPGPGSTIFFLSPLDSRTQRANSFLFFAPLLSHFTVSRFLACTRPIFPENFAPENRGKKSRLEGYGGADKFFLPSFPNLHFLYSSARCSKPPPTKKNYPYPVFSSSAFHALLMPRKGQHKKLGKTKKN